MDSSSTPPFNFFGERLAEIIKKAIKQQMSQSGGTDTLKPELKAMVEQQQQTNAQLGHLVTAVSQFFTLTEAAWQTASMSGVFRKQPS